MHMQGGETYTDTRLKGAYIDEHCRVVVAVCNAWDLRDLPDRESRREKREGEEDTEFDPQTEVKSQCHEEWNR